MGAPKGELWQFFAEKVLDGKHFKRAYCLGCIEHYRPPNDTTDVNDLQSLFEKPWFKSGA